MGKSRTGKKKRKDTSQRPGFFSEFGKPANDLLRKGYNHDQMLSISTKSFSGVNLSAKKHGRRSSIEVGTKYNSGNAAIEICIDKKSCISTNLTYSGALLPSANVSALLKFPNYRNSKISTSLVYRGKNLLSTEIAASLKLPLPDYRNSMVKVQCLHTYAALAMSVVFKQTPAIKLSTTIGNPRMAFGMEATHHTQPCCFTDWQAGFSMSNPRFSAALVIADKGDHFRMSYVHYFDQSRKTAAVAEITTKLSEKTHTFAVGGSCTFNHLTTVKGKVDNQGKIEALVRIKQKSSLTICSEYDTKMLEKMPRIGIAVALNL